MTINFPSKAHVYLFFVGFGSIASGNVSIFNFTITENEVSFLLQGEIDNGVTLGPASQFQLYIGVPGDDDWITANTFTETIVNNGSPSALLNTTGPGLSNDSTRGDNLQVQLVGAPTSGFMIGDTIDASVTFLGSYIPANLAIEDLIVSVGTDGTINSTLPDVNYQIGSAVPEVSSYGLITGLSAWLFALRRKRI